MKGSTKKIKKTPNSSVIFKSHSGFFNNNSTISKLPDWTASDKGVSPINSFVFTSIFLCERIKEMISFVQYKIAQWIGQLSK